MVLPASTKARAARTLNFFMIIPSSGRSGRPAVPWSHPYHILGLSSLLLAASLRLRVPQQLPGIGGDAAAFFARGSGASRTNGPTLLPLLLATRFPQQKIPQDEFPIAGSKRRTANSARYFVVTALRSGFGSDDLIKRACGQHRQTAGADGRASSGSRAPRCARQQSRHQAVISQRDFVAQMTIVTGFAVILVLGLLSLALTLPSELWQESPTAKKSKPTAAAPPS